MRIGVSRTTLMGLLVVAGVLVAPIGALALDDSPRRLTQVSGASTLAACLGDQPGAETNFVDSEVESWIAVDRSDTSHIIATWQQDRWSRGGSRGAVTAVSFDGGTTWSTQPLTKSSICTGGTAANGGNYERASDPWVDIGPTGDTYLLTGSGDTNPGGFGVYPQAVLVMKSTDGGRTWGDPTVLRRDTNPNIFNDKPSLTADPRDSRFVYVVWDQLVSPPGEVASEMGFEHAVGYRGPTWFARTTNGGQTWEPAREIYDPGTVNNTLGNQIVVLPNGELIDFFDLIVNFENAHKARGFNIAFIRSTDKGATWSRRATIVDKHVVPRVTDPDTDQPHRTEDRLLEVAVDPNGGQLYAVWQDGRFTGRSAVAFSMSSDGGVTWSPTIKINQTPSLGNLNDQAFLPSVDVADDGTVGVTYYDFRNNAAGGGTVTDLWMVHCHAACTSAANWQENHVAGPFDSRKAPFSRGFFLGDYVGLDHRGNTFTPFFTQTTATDPANQYYAEVGP